LPFFGLLSILVYPAGWTNKKLARLFRASLYFFGLLCISVYLCNGDFWADPFRAMEQIRNDHNVPQGSIGLLGCSQGALMELPGGSQGLLGASLASLVPIGSHGLPGASEGFYQAIKRL
jgi:hypothetical protein